MAVYFQLYKPDQTEPEDLNAVDEAICKHLGIEVHPVKYACGWFDSIGYLIASGRALGSQELRDKIKEWFSRDAEYLEVAESILKFLEENYKSTSWSGR